MPSLKDKLAKGVATVSKPKKKKPLKVGKITKKIKK